MLIFLITRKRESTYQFIIGVKVFEDTNSYKYIKLVKK